MCGPTSRSIAGSRSSLPAFSRFALIAWNDQVPSARPGESPRSTGARSDGVYSGRRSSTTRAATEEGSIVVGDDYGYIHTIRVDGLVKAFQAAGRDVRCVIVNACSTERLAQALAATGLCVIGMRQPVGDQSAVRFSIGFYQALADGQPVDTAFDSGVAQLMMTPMGDDARAPFLLCGGTSRATP